MRQAGRYLSEYRILREKAGNFLNLCYNPKLAAKVTLQPVERFGFDAAILFSDILVVPHALGQEVKFVDGNGPRLRAIRSKQDLNKLFDRIKLDRLSPIYETVSLVAGHLSKDVALIGFAGAPWTVAAYMVEGGTSKNFEFIKEWTRRDPSGFEILINRLIEATTAHLYAQIEAGAEVVQLFESWAGIASSSDFQKWCVEPVKIITKRVKERFPDVPVIAFPRGAAMGYVGYAEATGVDALSVDYTLSPAWVAETLQPHVPIQGNLDPQVLLVGGSAMKDAVHTIKSALNGGPFVFNLGHGVLPQTPTDHVAKLVQLVREE